MQAKGFKDYRQTGIELPVGSNIHINVPLQVGSITETVEVQASASMVETSQTGVANVIEGSRINELPLNGRQATALVLGLGAAVTAPGGGMVGSKNYFSSTTISVAGGQANGTAYLLDGGPYSGIPVVPEAISYAPPAASATASGPAGSSSPSARPSTSPSALPTIRIGATRLSTGQSFRSTRRLSSTRRSTS